MLSTSKQGTSENGDLPLTSRYKYDIRAYLQEAEKGMFKQNLAYARGVLRVAIKDLKLVMSQSQEAVKFFAILQEADKALLENKPVVAHSAMRLAITELTATS